MCYNEKLRQSLINTNPFKIQSLGKKEDYNKAELEILSFWYILNTFHDGLIKISISVSFFDRLNEKFPGSLVI